MPVWRCPPVSYVLAPSALGHGLHGFRSRTASVAGTAWNRPSLHQFTESAAAPIQIPNRIQIHTGMLVAMTSQTQGARTRLSRDESREETRRRLVDSATELFARFGVSDTSLHTVAEHAGYSRGAFHSNFDDKAELAEAVALSATSTIGPTLDALLSGPSPSSERLRDYIRGYLSFCAEHPVQTGALIAVVGFQSRFDTARFTSRMEESFRGLIGLFEDGQNRDEMRPFDPWFMAYVLRTTLDASAARIDAGTLPTSAEETINEVVDIFDLATRRETN